MKKILNEWKKFTDKINEQADVPMDPIEADERFEQMGGQIESGLEKLATLTVTGEEPPAAPAAPVAPAPAPAPAAPVAAAPAPAAPVAAAPVTPAAGEGAGEGETPEILATLEKLKRTTDLSAGQAGEKLDAAFKAMALQQETETPPD